MKVSQGNLCIIKTTDQEMIVCRYIEEGEDYVIVEDPYAIYFQDVFEDGRRPRIYLNKYNMFSNNRFTTISKYSIITLYESSEDINTLYAYYLKQKSQINEHIRFVDLNDQLDDDIDVLSDNNKNNSNNTIH